MTKKSKVFSFSFVLLIVACFLTVGYFGNQFLWTGTSKDSTEILFDVAPGQSLNVVVENLLYNGLIRNAKVFSMYARFKKMDSKLKVGEYSLNHTMNADQILATLASGKSVTRNFTIAEGISIFDIADIFEKAGYGTKAEFFNLVRDKAFIKSLLNEDLESLEGYLFPETYKITKFETMKSIVTQMVKRFLVVWSKYENTAKLQNLTRNQVVTFASIVEKESGLGADRPVVASVFHNRLAQKIKLQTDPTVLYGVALLKGQMPNNITKADLVTPTRYNSYTNYGLPPTPISNPGEESIKAVLFPANTKYLFFVSRNDGTTQFSETLAAHNLAVKNFQLNPKARDGKSWRDLKKTTGAPNAKPTTMPSSITSPASKATPPSADKVKK